MCLKGFKNYHDMLYRYGEYIRVVAIKEILENSLSLAIKRLLNKRGLFCLLEEGLKYQAAIGKHHVVQ